jgi:hypothetical protein
MHLSLPPIPDHIRREANKLHEIESSGGPFNNSLLEGEGLLHGIVGELIVRDFLKSEGVATERVRKPDFDLLANGVRVEVKTQRQSGPAIMPYYDVNVQDRLCVGLPQQNCDLYVFCRVDNDVQYGGIVGWQTHWAVYHSGTWKTRKKGETMGSGRGATNDCWVQQFGALPSPKLLPDYVLHWSKKCLQPC